MGLYSSDYILLLFYALITQQTIQQIIDRADILDVVGHFVQLKRRGANYLGLCPFHNEKTPSFTVSPSKGIYKCFGCGRAGNPITFVQEHEKMTYPEALRWLAKRYQVEVEEKEQSQEEKKQVQEAESIRIVNEFAVQYFSNILFTDEEGKRIGLSYFKERGYIQRTMEEFALGYCPEDGQSFASAAVQAGYQKNILLQSGLVRERNGNVYDMYAGRVIFPIQNQSGKYIGFGARILKRNDKAPKYINTPENPVYQKSKTLYGIYQARKEISGQDECLLAEGYTDVISLHQAGVKNVVASSGTSLTKEQIYLIKRYSANLTIIYDGDDAGIKAALRGLDLALEIGCNVHCVLLPKGHDPDSFIREQGAEGFTKYIAGNKKDIVLFKLEASLREAENDTLKKTQLINDIAETISKINKIEDFAKQQDYIKRSSELLQIEEGAFISLINKKIRAQLRKKDVPREETDQMAREAEPDTVHSQELDVFTSGDYMQEKGLLRVLLQFGNKELDEKWSVAEHIFNQVEADDMENENWQRLFILYRNYFQEKLQYPDIRYFTYHEDEKIRASSIEAVETHYELSENWLKKYQIEVPPEEEAFRKDIEQTLDYFYIRKIRSVYALTAKDLQDEKNMDPTQIAELYKALDILKNKEIQIASKMRIKLIR